MIYVDNNVVIRIIDKKDIYTPIFFAITLYK